MHAVLGVLMIGVNVKGEPRCRTETEDPPAENSIILLKISDALKKEQVVTNFLAKTGKDNGFIVVELNHIYDNKKIVSDISTSWDKTLTLFSKRATEKAIQEEAYRDDKGCVRR